MIGDCFTTIINNYCFSSFWLAALGCFLYATIGRAARGSGRGIFRTRVGIRVLLTPGLASNSLHYYSLAGSIGHHQDFWGSLGLGVGEEGAHGEKELGSETTKSKENN